MRKLTIYSDEFNEYSDNAEDTMVLDVLQSVATQHSSLVELNITAPVGELAVGPTLFVLTFLTRLTCLEVCTETLAVTRPGFAAGSRLLFLLHISQHSCTVNK